MTRRRLFHAEAYEEADVRPTLLGVVTLAFLLLFFLLTTSAGARLSTLALVDPESAEGADLPHPGPVSDLRVALLPDGAAELRFRIQTTDIAAASTSREDRALRVVPRAGTLDAEALGAAVARIHALDPAQTKAALMPDATTDTATLIAAMDALRGTSEAPRFTAVSLAEDPAP